MPEHASATNLAGQMTQAFAARDRNRVERYDLGDAKRTEPVTEVKLEKQKPVMANYRPAFSAARCAECARFRGDRTKEGTCQVVEGPIDPNCTCDLFAPERENLGAAADNYYRAMVERYAKEPSDDIDPEKAKKILKDGEVNGEPLTEAQRGMFGAASGKA